MLEMKCRFLGVPIVNKEEYTLCGEEVHVKERRKGAPAKGNDRKRTNRK